MLAETEWDFGDFMLSVIWIFFFVIWLWLLFSVFGDVFRRHDIGGWAKALWILFVIFLPYLGVFVYLISQGGGIAERSAAAQKAAVDQVRQQIGYSVADELQKLAMLREQGQVTDAEYERLRAKALA